MWKPTYAQTCSAIYFGCYALVGAALSSLGPALINLADQTGTDIGGVSFIFPVRSLAYLIGSAIGGPLFDRLPGHYLFSFAMSLACIGTTLLPFCKTVVLLALTASVQGLSIGFLDTGSNVLLVWVHGDEKVAPYLQFIHFAFGVGAFIAPLLVELSVNAIAAPSLAFWIIGALFAPIAAVLLFVKSPRQDSAVKADGEQAAPPPARSGGLGRYEMALVVIAACIMFVYVGTEIGEGSYIFTYSVLYAGFTEAQGHYLTSAFWGSLALGRLIAVPVSIYVKPARILLFNFTGSLVSVFLIAVFPASHGILWACTVTYGLCMSCIFPSVLNMLQGDVPLTGKLTSALVISGALGEMVVPLVLAFVFEQDPSTFVFLIYILVMGAAVSLVLMAVFMFVSRRRRLTKAYSSLEEDGQLQVDSEEDEIGMDDDGNNFKMAQLTAPGSSAHLLGDEPIELDEFHTADDDDDVQLL